MQYDNSMPIYIQVAEDIRNKIISGEICLGDKLPSGRDLAIQYKINPNTAVRVYQVLEQEGLCHTKRGLGTFINDDLQMIEEIKKQQAFSYITSFLANMHSLGFSDHEILAMLKEQEDSQC